MRKRELSVEVRAAVLGAPAEQRELDVLRVVQAGESTDAIGR
jgi:hypothetical protein